MSSINLVMLSGTITSEVELTSRGCEFDFKSVHQEPNFTSECLVTVVAFGALGRLCIDKVKQGNRVYVEGKLRNSSKELPSGKKHYFTEVIAKDIQVI